MRTDAQIDGRAVVCKNSSLIGYSSNVARVGYFLVYRDGEQTKMARMIGRIKYAPALSGDFAPIRGYILALVLSASGHWLGERWINPDDVVEVYEKPPTALAAFFFTPTIPHDAQTLRKLVAHGTLQDQFVHLVPERVAEFARRWRE